jgi:hypothetical protein
MTKSAEGISDEAVRKRTGRGWDEWFALLDEAGAKKMQHKEIALLLRGKLGAGDWWSQMVTVEYERARGLRELYQGAGGYRVSVGKTLDVPVDALYEAWSKAIRRARWLGKEELQIRKATAPKSMRITWADGTNLEVNFYAKGAAKSQVSVQHSKLNGKKDVEQRRKFWKDALERLQSRLK